MRIILQLHEKMLLELLRAALTTSTSDTSIFHSATPAEWKACYRLSIEQGVMALAWDGITQLPEQVLPPKDIKITWALEVEKYERRYHRYCKTATEISELYKRRGIQTLFLKGVGYSLCYPIPSHREGGDIDIYTYAANPSVMSDAEANALANRIMRDKQKDVVDTSDKHSLFYYNGIPIENHRTYLDIHEWKIARPLDKQLHDISDWKEIALDGCKDKIMVPTDRFNTLFIAFHAMQHYGAGLCLHHLCDWTCLLNTCGLHLPAGTTSKRFEAFAYGLTAFTNTYLGTHIQDITYTEEMLDKIMEQVFRYPYKESNRPHNLFGKMIYKTRHFFYYRRILKDLIGHVPVSYGLTYTLKRILKTPSRLFNIGSPFKINKD